MRDDTRQHHAAIELMQEEDEAEADAADALQQLFGGHGYEPEGLEVENAVIEEEQVDDENVAFNFQLDIELFNHEDEADDEIVDDELSIESDSD
jgi:hypothetical protein